MNQNCEPEFKKFVGLHLEGKTCRGVAEECQNNEEAKAEYDYMIRFDSKVYINK